MRTVRISKSYELTDELDGFRLGEVVVVMPSVDDDMDVPIPRTASRGRIHEIRKGAPRPFSVVATDYFVEPRMVRHQAGNPKFWSGRYTSKELRKL